VSLVSEALKKAQHEAAQREAKEKGLPAPLLAAHPYRARRDAPRVALWGLAAATILLLATAGYLWFGGSSKDERLPMKGENGSASAPGGASAAPAQPAPTAAAKSHPGGSTVAGEPSSHPSEGAPPVAEIASGRPEFPSVGASGPPSAATVSAAPPAKAPSPSPPARPGGIERTFVRVAQLADGGQIHLGGIAWSQTAPLAYVNGRLLGVGESVAGLTVERIERDRVVLSGPGGRVTVTLR
jgi:hypothetical protein